jgi:penicillin-binding protein 1C
MEIFLILLLILPLILIRIGESTRFVLEVIWKLIVLTYNKIFSALFLILKSLFAPQKQPQPKPKYIPVKKVQINTNSEYREQLNLRQLWSIYMTSFKNAIGYIIPKHPLINIEKTNLDFPKIPLPRLTQVRNRFRKIFRRFTTPTPQHPFTIYPAPIRLAWQIKSFFSGVVLTIIFLLIPLSSYQWLKSLPNPVLLTKRDIEVSTKIFDRNGELLYEIYADENRTPLSLEQIPLIVQEATISIEDKDFYKHQGFSVKGIIRAAYETLMNHKIQGGSTITQQLIKSALLTPDVTISRKIREIILAFWAERLYTKQQILEMYLNQVPYGGTAWGVESASQTYFGKSIKDITLGQAALLAGLPAAPTEYSPFGLHPQMAYERQHEVIRRMIEDHYISEEDGKKALAEKIQFVSPRVSIRAPHFVMYIKDYLENTYGPRMVERGGLRVKTSLDINMQDKAQEIVQNQIKSLTPLRVGNGAALVTNPKTGEIYAMVGSHNYFDTDHDGNVNVTTALRQPGSSIKVVTYAAALENGLTAASIIDDSPVVYHFPGSPSYAPVNYDGRFHGQTPLRYALGNSYNIPAVKTLARIGLRTMIDKARLMGISSWEDESRFGLSLTLGGGEITMTDMVEVFGSLANEGRRNDIMPILEITDYTGKVLEKHSPGPGVVATSPEVAYIMSNILSDNTARTAAFGPTSSLVIPGKTVSVKTGTSNDKRDNWTIGYTPSLLAAVWVGNNDNSPMDPQLTSGITGAAPIWHDIMAEFLKNKPDEVSPQPNNVISIPCYNNRMELFVRGTEPAGGRCAPLPTLSPTPSSKPN